MSTKGRVRESRTNTCQADILPRFQRGYHQIQCERPFIITPTKAQIIIYFLYILYIYIYTVSKQEDSSVVK